MALLISCALGCFMGTYSALMIFDHRKRTGSRLENTMYFESSEDDNPEDKWRQ